jgi:multiple sugar transport system substrate-binding protein
VTRIDLSICLSRNQIAADLEAVLKPYNMTRAASSAVHISVIPWETYKDELTATAIYGKGPDISQVGAPLVNDLVVMNALRPFTSREILGFGGSSTFHATAWQSSRRVFEGQIWAMPWLSDPHTLLYWKDFLSQAGVQEQNAFNTFDQMEQTLQSLQASGFEAPWVLPIGHRFNSLHAACTWIWGAGGDFVSVDNRTPFFHHPEAISGLKRHFSLYRFMPKKGQPLDDMGSNQLFINRKAVATMGNLTLLRNIPPDLQSKIGVTLPPGAPLVGGSSLVIWKHTRNEQDAVELVKFLLSKNAQVQYCQRLGYLPVRTDALLEPPYTTDPILRGFTLALQKGRLFPLIRLGGLLEEKLSALISNIWAQLVAGQAIDIDATLTQELAPIVRHFEQWTG